MVNAKEKAKTKMLCQNVQCLIFENAGTYLVCPLHKSPLLHNHLVNEISLTGPVTGHLSTVLSSPGQIHISHIWLVKVQQGELED